MPSSTPGPGASAGDAAAALGRIGTAEEVEAADRGPSRRQRQRAYRRHRHSRPNQRPSGRRASLRCTSKARPSDIRKAAAESLGQIGDPAALESLVARLKDPGWSVRLAAANALGQIRDPRGVEPLIGPWKTPTPTFGEPLPMPLAALGWEAERAPRHEWGGRTQLEARAGRRHPSWPIAGGLSRTRTKMGPRIGSGRSDRTRTMAGATTCPGGLGSVCAAEPSRHLVCLRHRGFGWSCAGCLASAGYGGCGRTGPAHAGGRLVAAGERPRGGLARPLAEGRLDRRRVSGHRMRAGRVFCCSCSPGRARMDG